MRLFDFRRPEAVEGWEPLHDRVMGGCSSGRLESSDAENAVFSGEVSPDNGGGFASIRSPSGPFDLSAYSGLEIRVRGDGQRYGLRLQVEPPLDDLRYGTGFVAGDAWETIRLPFRAMQPTRRGRAMPDAPALDPARVLSIGCLIGNGQLGPFRLELAWIDAYREDAAD